jgi:hypothetical protein
LDWGETAWIRAIPGPKIPICGTQFPSALASAGRFARHRPKAIGFPTRSLWKNMWKTLWIAPENIQNLLLPTVHRF